MPLKTLQDLYLQELKELYDSEHVILAGLQKMANASSKPELTTAFYHHMDETRVQIKRLKRVFEGMGKRARKSRSAGIRGLVAEGKEYTQAASDPAVKDAGLISAAQRMEHYEMAGYGSARTFAGQLGYHEAAELLQQTLIEEQEADRVLTQIAETMVDGQATKRTPRYGQAYSWNQGGEF